MLSAHVHFRHFRPSSSSVPSAALIALIALITLVVLPAVSAAPAMAGDDDAASLALPEYATPGSPALFSTGDKPFWLDPMDVLWNRDYTVDWNTRFRGGRGSAGLVTEVTNWTADAKNNESYLEGADVIEMSQLVKLHGVVIPCVALSVEAGISQQQIRPDGDSGYDRYKWSYRVGGAVHGMANLGTFATFGAEAGFYTWEGRADDANNAQVTANNGNPVFLRAYLVRVDLRLMIELFGERNGGSFNIYVGGTFIYQWNRIILDTSSLAFRQPIEDSFNLLTGFVLGINEQFSLTAEARLLGIVSGRLSLEIWM
ncbi:MAG: hypothetical protein AB7K09_11185 [Planctomycetota bacterium]